MRFQNTKMSKHPNFNRGFTLIELMIVTAVFSIAMTAIAGLFVSALRTERSILASKKVLGQISYAAEYMTRSLRMAKRDNGEGCMSSPDLNYEVSASQDRITFINALQEDKCQEFFLEGGQLKHWTGSEKLSLTSADIRVENLKFELTGETKADNLQPFVTIYMEAYATSSPVLNVQTSVSQRNIDHQ